MPVIDMTVSAGSVWGGNIEKKKGKKRKERSLWLERSDNRKEDGINEEHSGDNA